jgi:ribosome production factor 2
MMEFTIDPNSFQSIQSLSKNRESIARYGAKSMLYFAGDIFDTNDDMKQFKSLMMDFFHIQDCNHINLAGLDRFLVFTASSDPTDISKKLVTFRHYTVLKKKGESKFPKVVLEEAGPRLDLNFNRAVRGSHEIQVASMKAHKAAKIKHAKNVEVGYMGELLGRLHMEKQDFNQIAFKKTKALGKGKRANIIAPLTPIDYKAVSQGTIRKSPPKDDDGDFSDDFEKIVKGSTKRQKTVPSAYLGKIISE